MIEPKNPITVIKSNKEYPAADCYKLKAPFSLKTNGSGSCNKTFLDILPGEKPIYFKRKQIKNSLSSKGLKQTLESIKYCLGKVNKDGSKIEYWIDSKGVII